MKFLESPYVCKHHGQVADEFIMVRKRTAKDGSVRYSRGCLICHRDRARKLYRENEKYRLESIERRKRNAPLYAERKKKVDSEWRKRNLEKIKVYSKTDYIKRRDRILEGNKERAVKFEYGKKRLSKDSYFATLLTLTTLKSFKPKEIDKELIGLKKVSVLIKRKLNEEK